MIVQEAPDILKWLSENWDLTIEWDSGNIEKLKKHDFVVSDIEEAVSGNVVFGGEILGEFSEKRFILFSKLIDGRYITIVWTIRKTKFRPISCRRSRDNEKKFYEKNIQ